MLRCSRAGAEGADDDDDGGGGGSAIAATKASGDSARDDCGCEAARRLRLQMASTIMIESGVVSEE